MYATHFIFLEVAETRSWKARSFRGTTQIHALKSFELSDVCVCRKFNHQCLIPSGVSFKNSPTWIGRCYIASRKSTSWLLLFKEKLLARSYCSMHVTIAKLGEEPTARSMLPTLKYNVTYSIFFECSYMTSHLRTMKEVKIKLPKEIINPIHH